MPILEMIAAAAKISAAAGEAAVVKGSEVMATKIAESQTLETVVYQLEIVRDNSLEALKAKVETEIEIHREAKAAEDLTALGKEAGKLDEEKSQIEKNRLDGLERERTVHGDLVEKYSESEGYQVHEQRYLLDANGKIVKDPVTGEARRIDFLVSKDGEVIDSVEVTSETAPKELQLEKEERIREAGGNYIQDRSTGELIRFAEGVQTRVRRLA
jgi:hypothetical protein